MAIKLVEREKEHQARGHYHFDPKQNTVDILKYHCDLPKDACDEISRIAIESYEERGRDPADPLFVWHDLEHHLNRKSTYYSNDDETRRRDSEMEFEDRSSWMRPWINSKFDKARPYAAVVATDQFEPLRQAVEYYVKKYNWLGNQPNTGHKVWIQYPGQITPAHIDHIYAFYQDRDDIYENPMTRRKTMTILTKWEAGNYFCWGNTMIGRWDQGMTYTWAWGLPHWTANLGNKARVSINWNSARWFSDEEFANGFGETL